MNILHVNSLGFKKIIEASFEKIGEFYTEIKNICNNTPYKVNEKVHGNNKEHFRLGEMNENKNF
jgi:hypothetical protein